MASASASAVNGSGPSSGEPSVLERFYESQRHVPRLSVPDEARIIVDLGR